METEAASTVNSTNVAEIAPAAEATNGTLSASPMAMGVAGGELAMPTIALQGSIVADNAKDNNGKETKSKNRNNKNNKGNQGNNNGGNNNKIKAKVCIKK